MTYAEALTMRDALEAQLLAGAGLASVQIGDRTITYQTQAQARSALNQLNRDILSYERRSANINPTVSTPRWR